MDENRMDYETLLDTLEKAENGPVLDEKTWDSEIIGKNFRETSQKYDIQMDANDPYVTSNDDLADRLWEAGMEVAVNTGLYCIDTKRQMQWERGCWLSTFLRPRMDLKSTKSITPWNSKIPRNLLV